MAETAIRNLELVLALKVFKAEDTPAARAAILKALTTARLVTPGTVDRSTDANGIARPQLKCMVLTKPDGGKVIPVFSDKEELESWKPGTQSLVLGLPDLLKLLMADMEGIVINPKNQNIFMNRQMLLPRPAPVAVPNPMFDKSKPVQVVQIGDLPEKITQGFDAAMAAAPAVREGWLRMMVQENKRVWLTVLALDEGTEAKPVMDAVAKALAPVLVGAPLTLAAADSALGQQAISQGTSQYIRA